MQEAQRELTRVPDPPKYGAEPSYEQFVDIGRQGLLRRAFAGLRHGYGLAFGALSRHLRELPKRERWNLRLVPPRLLSALGGLLVDRRLKREAFPVQLRVRLERLGPTYIKLGQILSLREDLFPKAVTDELKKLLDQLPAVPYERFLEIATKELGRPVDEVFTHIRSTPLGSASIGQIHLATTLDGERVILKVVKPGIRATLKRDTLLLRGLGSLLQLLIPRYQPRRVISEFCRHILREVDLRLEADNAETFTADFRGQTDIVFPRIYREHCTRDLLCMEFLDGIKPTDPKALSLAEDERRRIIDLGAEAIVCMIYRDGFFHADLHPANLLILPGPKVGFVDLGMVGRFDADLKRTLLYYFYSLVMGDAETAATYLTAIAETRPGSDPVAFRRDVEDVCRQWSHRARFNAYSLGRLVLQSIGRAASHRMYFPVEMVLMVKALVTFEAVGQALLPDFDTVTVAKPHVHRVLLERFAPLKLARDSITSLPELVDALAKTPRLITEGLQLVEQATKRPSQNPFAGLRATLFGGACLVAGAILAGFGGPWPVWGALLLIGLLLPLRRGS